MTDSDKATELQAIAEAHFGELLNRIDNKLQLIKNSLVSARLLCENTHVKPKVVVDAINKTLKETLKKIQEMEDLWEK